MAQDIFGNPFANSLGNSLFGQVSQDARYGWTQQQQIAINNIHPEVERLREQMAQQARAQLEQQTRDALKYGVGVARISPRELTKKKPETYREELQQDIDNWLKDVA